MATEGEMHSVEDDTPEVHRDMPAFQDKSPLQQHLDSLKENYESGRYADLTVQCGGRQWRVQRSLLGSISKVFDKMVCGDFKEARTGQVLLDDDDPEAVNQLLRYSSYLDYEPTPHTTGEISPLVLHYRVAAVAHKYAVPKLGDFAHEKFLKDSETFWRHAEFAEAIEEIWNGEIDEGHRFHDSMLRISMRHFQQFDTERDRYSAFWKAVVNTPGFAVELLQGLAPLVAQVCESGVQQKRYQCPSCQAIFLAFIATEDRFMHKCDKKNSFSSSDWKEYALDP